MFKACVAIFQHYIQRDQYVLCQCFPFALQHFLTWHESLASLTPFIRNVGKWPKMLLKSCSLNSTRCLKHVWSFFNILLGRVSMFCTNVSRLFFSIFRLGEKLVSAVDVQIFVCALLCKNSLSRAILKGNSIMMLPKNLLFLNLLLLVTFCHQ